MEQKEQIIKKIETSILEYDEDMAMEAAEAVLQAGIAPMEAITAMGDALTVLGEKLATMEVFLPEVLMASDAFNVAMKVLEPELKKQAVQGEARNKVIIGTVKGDVHTMGKDLVSTLFAVGGFDVKDLGVDVDPKVFIEEAEAMGADIIAVSSLMSTTMPNQKQVIDFLEAKGLREKYIVMIGGGPCTAEYAETIGADGFGKDAVEAVAVARQLLAQK